MAEATGRGMGQDSPADHRKYPRVFAFAALAYLTGPCALSPVSAEPGPLRYSAIPNQVRAALGCDSRIRGNGSGRADKVADMLGGYAPELPNPGPAISIFWCAQAADRFLLAFVRDGKLMHPECSPALVWHNNPRGLSLSEEAEPLDQFVYLDDLNRDWVNNSNIADQPPMRTGPSGEMTSGSIILDGDESLANEFYCYRGAWMVRVLH